MATLLSEMERFEQEMKELGADLDPMHSRPRVTLPPPPPPPPRTGGALTLVRMPSSTLPPPPPPPPPRTSSAVTTSAFAAAPTALPPTSLKPSSPSASGFFPPQTLPSPPPMSPAANGVISARASPPLARPPPPPPSPPSVSPGMRSQASPNAALPPTPPGPPSASQAAGSPMSWLGNGSQGTAPLAKPPATATNANHSAPQFSYQPATSSYPATRPSSSTPGPPPYFPVPFHLQPQLQQSYHTQQQSNQATSASHYQYQSHYQPPISAPEIYTLPQQRQAQQLFQRDAQTITPEALESVKAALASGDGEHKSESKKRAIPRKAAGQTWEDPTLSDWPENDHRLFCGDLGNEVNDEVLTKAFSRFPTFNMARVVRDKRTGKTKGYGFVSFANPSDLALALKEMNGKYVGNRPIKLRKSTWKERTDFNALERQKVVALQNAKRAKTARKNVLHR